MSYEVEAKVRALKWSNRFLVLRILFVGALLLGGSYAGLLYFKTNDALTNLNREQLIEGQEVVTSSQIASDYTADDGQPHTYLLIGSDSRGADTGRSDTLMVAQVPRDREYVYLISLPRDSYVNIPGHGYNKINAAYSLGGAPLAVKTVEELLHTKIDHVAVVNFTGFMNLVDHVGGITVNNPHDACDTSQNVCWKAGHLELDKKQALSYVRWRSGLPDGDFSRAENQQRVLKAIASKVISSGAISTPDRAIELLKEVSGYVTVDAGFSDSEIISAVVNLKISSSQDIRQVLLPTAGFENIGGLGSVNILHDEKLAELRTALAKDTMMVYWSEHRKDASVG